MLWSTLFKDSNKNITCCIFFDLKLIKQLQSKVAHLIHAQMNIFVRFLFDSHISVVIVLHDAKMNSNFINLLRLPTKHRNLSKETWFITTLNGICFLLITSRCCFFFLNKFDFV